MNPEVRYHMLRPAQIVARRKACPVVYIPIGNLEWHGRQNALGADTLQAEGIAIRCAQKGGGLVFPPLYYGENRLENLIEATGTDKEKIAEEMGLPPENFSRENHPFSVIEQTKHYNKLLYHILAEAESLGFELGVFVAGHYPLIDHARAAVLQWNRRESSRFHGGMLAWTFRDDLLLADMYEHAGDHAAKWETSHMMALHPETVDLNLLPPKGEPLVGIMGQTHPQDSTESFGCEILEAAVDLALKEVKHRMDHKEHYWFSGKCLDEGLWKSKKF